MTSSLNVLKLHSLVCLVVFAVSLSSPRELKPVLGAPSTLAKELLE